eukprot:CAMPEP_0194126124 /NCGR_PEP_ID=MMETSP0150-20130528/59824_1 /TAXON_ID=122233 /ORGANISM="Chaetoceros debilis, Strain MM31A-1" /LENGTH=549 /DNA_ID=CAMNT_0038819969 /DNA_START=368 /DNA_END=2017 /DNA_ORIENTATION=-
MSLSARMSSVAFPSSPESSDDFILARLHRQRWKIRKGSTKYRGCQLTIAHIPIHPQSDSQLHMSSQTAEINIIISLHKISREHFDSLEETKMLPENVKSLAAAWYQLAETRSGPLASGGWDECVASNTDTSQSDICEVHVIIPHELGGLDGKKDVDIDLLEFLHVSICLPDNQLQHLNPREYDEAPKSPPFSYFGGRTMFFPGMFDLCTRRSILFSSRHCTKFGEVTVPPELFHGARTASLAALAFQREIRHSPQTREGVVKIENARLVTLKFCRARAECSRCFSALVSSNPNSRKKKIEKKRRAELDNKPSFWNNPIPIPTTMQAPSWAPDESIRESCDLRQSALNTRPSCLMCPSGCDFRYAHVKWEMSGDLSDGTSSTLRIYAERDAAVLLLGRGLNIDAINKGAWESPRGIIYQGHVDLDTVLIRELESIKRRLPRNTIPPPETFLLPESRARYELYRHCCTSKELHRRLDFLCRIKSRSASKSPFKPFELSLMTKLGDGNDGVIRSNNASMEYQAPELSLIDCLHCYKHDSELGWDLLNAMNRT